MSSKVSATRSPASPSNSNKRKLADQIVVSPCSLGDSLDSSQHEIDWGDSGQIAEMHETRRLRDPKFNKVKRNDIIRSINKHLKETLSITYINCSIQIFSVTPNPNSLKTEQALVHAFAELILSNIGVVQVDDDAVAERKFLSKSEYSKIQSISDLLILKQGGFADSVEIKKVGGKGCNSLFL